MSRLSCPLPGMLRIVCVAAFLIACSPPVYAGYNANIQGVVTKVLTYTGDGRIFLRLSNQPSSHPQCSTDYFSIDASVSDSVRSQLLARLLVAYSTGEVVNIGYDSQGDCSHGRIRVYRVG